MKNCLEKQEKALSDKVCLTVIEEGSEGCNSGRTTEYHTIEGLICHKEENTGSNIRRL